jgi:RND family efflux transporter MFP subunit
VFKRILAIGVPLVIIAAGVGGAFYLKSTKPEIVSVPPSERVWPIETQKIKLGDEQPDWTLYGRIFAGREVELRPLVAGRITAVGRNFRDGGVVEEGELLVQVDPFDYQTFLDEASAQLAEARARHRELAAEYKGARNLLVHDEAQVKLRRRDVQRREKLRGSGAGSVKTLDDSKMALSENEQSLVDRRRAIDTYKAKLGQQNATIDRLAVSLRRAERDLENARLTAPFDGFLVDADAELGKRLGVGDRVARLIDARRMEVRFHIGNKRFSQLLSGGGYKGRTARVYWGGREDLPPLNAVLERESSEIDTAGGGVELFARLTDLDKQSVLRPGAFVRVVIPGRKYENVVRLPEAALHNYDTIYLVEEGRLKSQPVTFVARVDADVLVKGDLREGLVVATSRFPEIGPGVKVSAP